MKVIKFAPGLIPVFKHQEHDQSTHGSWAGDGVSFEQDRNSLTMQDKSGQTLASVDFVNLGNNRLDINSIDSFDGGKGYATKVLEKLYSLFPEHSIFWGKTIVPESTHLAQKFSDKYGRTEFMPWGEGVIAGYEWGQLYGDTTVKKHQEHDQSTHGSWATGQTGDASTRELLLQQASQYETFEEFSNAVSLEGLRPRAWHIADTGFELDPNFKPMSRTGGTSDEPGLFVGDPETWQDYAVGRSTVIEYDVSNLSFTAKPLADTSADFFPDQSGNQGFFIRPSAFSRLREVRRMPIEEALSRAKQQQDAMPKSKAEAKQIWEESRSVKKHQEHDQSSHGNWAEGSQGTTTELTDGEIQDILHNTKTIEEMYQKVAERLGKSLKPKVAVIPEGEENLYRGLGNPERDAQQLVDGRIPFTPFQTWGQGIYATPHQDDAKTYGQVVRMKLDDSANILRTESEAFAVDTTSTPFKSDFVDFASLLPKITSGEIDNFSISDAYNIYWAAKGYDGYQPHGGEIVLFNATHLTVNKTDIGTAVQKHQEHDQSSHGNWADGSSESGLDAMPYEWKPDLGVDDSRLPPYKSKELSEVLQNIAEAPIAIRLSAPELDSIIQEGRFKSLNEIPVEESPGQSQPYRDARSKLENGIWGVPKTGIQPIYGYMDTRYDGHEPQSEGYGDIKIILKDNVAGRTTFSAGDSLNAALTPVKITDARAGSLSNSALIAAHQSRSPEAAGYQDIFRSPSRISYYEAQIHGGVSLKDIKSVDIRTQTGYSPPLSESTIKTLEQMGIEVIRD